MTKIYVNDEYIRNKVIPSLDSAIDNLNSLINNVGTLNIPFDYEYASYLKQLPNEIYSLKSKLNEKKSNLQSVGRMYTEAENKNLIAIESIQNFYLLNREK